MVFSAPLGQVRLSVYSQHWLRPPETSVESPHVIPLESSLGYKMFEAHFWFVVKPPPCQAHREAQLTISTGTQCVPTPILQGRAKAAVKQLR
jgi:hypothetical protein